MQSYVISRPRFLCARSRRNRAAFEHIIVTTRQVIRDSQRLIERAERVRDDGIISGDPREKSDMNTGEPRKPS
jgi:hypothetical protein